MKSVADVVDEILEELGRTGIGGVKAWFAGRPNVAVYRSFDKYVVVVWRGCVAIEILLDESLNVKAAYVRYL